MTKHNVDEKTFGPQTLLDAFGQKTLSKDRFYNRVQHNVKQPFIKVDKSFANYSKIIKIVCKVTDIRSNSQPIVYFEPNHKHDARIIVISRSNDFNIQIFVRNDERTCCTDSPNVKYKWLVVENEPYYYPGNSWNELWNELDSLNAREVLAHLSINHSNATKHPKTP